MRIISKRTLKEFYENALYFDSKNSLEAWHKEAVNADWINSNEIKSKYSNASIIRNYRVVFNIHGNKYRLIVKINYLVKIIFVRFIGTHEKYDIINAKEV